MTPEQINVAVAELLGWRGIFIPDHCLWPEATPPGESMLVITLPIPNFAGSIDACLHVIKKAQDDGWRWYAKYLGSTFFVSFGRGVDELIRVENRLLAEAICEAFLRLHNRWVEN